MLPRRMFIASVLPACAALVCGCGTPRGGSLPSLTVAGAGDVSSPVSRGIRAVVILTLSVDCPLSNKVLPELRRLEDRFGREGFRFVHLYPNADETDDAVTSHRREFGLPPEAFRDTGSEWVRRFDLSVTPQALVVTPGGDPVYRGRIHDQFFSLGAGRPAPTTHDLEDALAEFMRSGRAAGKTTKAIGCRIRVHPPSETR